MDVFFQPLDGLVQQLSKTFDQSYFIFQKLHRQTNKGLTSQAWINLVCSLFSLTETDRDPFIGSSDFNGIQKAGEREEEEK